MAVSGTIGAGAYIGAAALASAIGVGGSIASGNMSYASSAKAQKQQFMYNMYSQMQAQNWSERMSNTAHQREVADLKAAGLNPILSANSGAAYSGASGSSVGAQGGQYDIDALAGAQMLTQMTNETKLRKSQVKLNESTEKLQNEEVNYKKSLGGQIFNQINNDNLITEANVAKTLAEIEQINEGTRLMGYNAQTNRINANANSANAVTNSKALHNNQYQFIRDLFGVDPANSGYNIKSIWDLYRKTPKPSGGGHSW